jgi:hypothetical protein
LLSCTCCFGESMFFLSSQQGSDFYQRRRSERENRIYRMAGLRLRSPVPHPADPAIPGILFFPSCVPHANPRGKGGEVGGNLRDRTDTAGRSPGGLPPCPEVTPPSTSRKEIKHGEGIRKRYTDGRTAFDLLARRYEPRPCVVGAKYPLSAPRRDFKPLLILPLQTTPEGSRYPPPWDALARPT